MTPQAYTERDSSPGGGAPTVLHYRPAPVPPPMTRLTRHPQRVLCKVCSAKTHNIYYAHCEFSILSPWLLVILFLFFLRYVIMLGCMYVYYKLLIKNLNLNTMYSIQYLRKQQTVPMYCISSEMENFFLCMTGFAKNSASSIRIKTIQWWWCSLQAPLSPRENENIYKKEVRQPQEKIKRKKLENLLQT